MAPNLIAASNTAELLGLLSAIKENVQRLQKQRWAIAYPDFWQIWKQDLLLLAPPIFRWQAYVFSGMGSNGRCMFEITYLSYRKVASSNTSCLKVYAGFFRLLMKETFDPYIL